VSGVISPAQMPQDNFGAPRIRRVLLNHFRSYAQLDLAISGRMIALSGENGAGKTNLLEALSLFTQGRGLRRADFPAMASTLGPGDFAISVEVETGDSVTRLGIGYQPQPDGTFARVFRIDGETVSSASAFDPYLKVVWLTPASDGLFSGAAGDRRRFLDRLVLAIDPSHGTRVSALERAMRSRNKLLEDERPDPAWLDAVEREVAETGVAVAAARRETVMRLRSLIQRGRDETSPFPWADLALSGPLEDQLAQHAALDVEDWFRGVLRDNLWRDRAAGRATVGPQSTDLLVVHGPKQVDAAQASTGEQKALLIGLVLAHAQLVADMSQMRPLVLLDEVAAHLDPRRRTALFDALEKRGGQVFMTGADDAAFTTLPANAVHLSVTQGKIDPIA
jgi:DNA replication and repair protein RecF